VALGVHIPLLIVAVGELESPDELELPSVDVELESPPGAEFGDEVSVSPGIELVPFVGEAPSVVEEPDPSLVEEPDPSLVEEPEPSSVGGVVDEVVWGVDELDPELESEPAFEPVPEEVDPVVEFDEESPSGAPVVPDPLVCSGGEVVVVPEEEDEDEEDVPSPSVDEAVDPEPLFESVELDEAEPEPLSPSPDEEELELELEDPSIG